MKVTFGCNEGDIARLFSFVELKMYLFIQMTFLANSILYILSLNELFESVGR